MIMDDYIFTVFSKYSCMEYQLEIITCTYTCHGVKYLPFIKI